MRYHEAMRVMAWGILAMLGVALAPACGDAAGSEFGAFGATCETGDTCNARLLCIGGECLPPSCDQCTENERCTPAGACVADGLGRQCDPPCEPGTFCSETDECIDDGTCNGSGDCATGLICDVPANLCVPGSECGQEEFVLEGLPPNVLITLDRTGSMDGTVPNSGGKTRYEVATEAIATVLATHGAVIDFGLAVFSACTAGGCAPGVVIEPIGADTNAINAAVANTSLCFSGENETAIGPTLNGLIGEASLQDPATDNVILLITDGNDNCGGGGDIAAASLLAQTVPVKTYVIGFSGGVDAGELQAIAMAGGTTDYNQADDQSQLDAALASIANAVRSCVYALNEVPPGEVNVFFDNLTAGVPNNATDGWTYDPTTNTITFHGAACDAIKNGDVDDIDVVFGCDAPTPD